MKIGLVLKRLLCSFISLRVVMSLNFVVICFNIRERLTPERQARGAERCVRQEPCSQFPGELPGGGAAGSAFLPVEVAACGEGLRHKLLEMLPSQLCPQLLFTAGGPRAGVGEQRQESGAGGWREEAWMHLTYSPGCYGTRASLLLLISNHNKQFCYK